MTWTAARRSLGLLALLALSGCGAPMSSDDTAEPRVRIDDLGATLVLPGTHPVGLATVGLVDGTGARGFRVEAVEPDPCLPVGPGRCAPGEVRRGATVDE
jgi:hypothetical protein